MMTVSLSPTFPLLDCHHSFTMLLRLPLVALSIFSFAFLVKATTPWTASPFSPASIPLAVRSPYLSTWLSQLEGEGTALNDALPTFWAGLVGLCDRDICIHDC